MVTAQVERIDPQSGAALIKIGKSVAMLPKSEQVGRENLAAGDYIKVYIADIKDKSRGPQAIISRSHPGLVKRLFEQEVPEIYDGTVEIKSISREAGSRTKMAVASINADVDAIGACIGPKGQNARLAARLTGWKIDIRPASGFYGEDEDEDIFEQDDVIESADEIEAE